MPNRKISRLLSDNPIITAVRDPKDIYEAVECDSEVIFLLTGNIYNLKKLVDYVLQADKFCFVHLDLLKGFAQDAYFIRYLKEVIGPTGAISTKNTLVTKAKQEGLMTIQRLFLLDSSAMDVALSAAKKIKPDAVEILPGLVPKIIERVSHELSIPIITGGFVETEEEIHTCLAAGAVAATTSCKTLWHNSTKIKDTWS